MKYIVPLGLIIGTVAVAVLAPNTTDYHFLSFLMIAGAVIITLN